MSARIGAQEAWLPEGLLGRAVTALAAAPSDVRFLYAGTGAGEVYRSEDGGRSWTRASAGLPPAPVRALAVDPGSPLIVYAGTEQGIFQSPTGGSSWTPSGTGIAGGEVVALAIDAGNPLILWASTDEPGMLHVYKSSDGGQSWEAVIIRGPGFGTPTNFGFVVSLVVSPLTSRVYAGWHEIVFFSDDGGNLWNKYPDVNHEVSAVLRDPFDPEVIYAGTFDAGVARSVSRAPWTFPAGLANEHVLALAADPTTFGRLYAALSDGRVVRSGDRGTSWSDTPPLRSIATVLLVTPGDAVVHAGTAGGVFRLGERIDVFPRVTIDRVPPRPPPVSLDPRD